MCDSKPKMNLTQFCVMKGLPTTADVESHIHAGLRSKPTTKTYERWFNSALRHLQDRRDLAVRLFRSAVENGEIIDANAVRDLERVAAGHPDNASTQAAKRLLEKRRNKEITE